MTIMSGLVCCLSRSPLIHCVDTLCPLIARFITLSTFLLYYSHIFVCRCDGAHCRLSSQRPSSRSLSLFCFLPSLAPPFLSDTHTHTHSARIYSFTVRSYANTYTERTCIYVTLSIVCICYRARTRVPQLLTWYLNLKTC